MDFEADLELVNDPYQSFETWFERAQVAGIDQPEAVSLATATPDGKPSLRMVLFKGISEKGFTFYTHYESRKGREIEKNPYAAMLFFWQPLARQIRLEGKIEWLSDAESSTYFASRDRGSQIGAWASHQSSPLESRAVLMQRVAELEEEYAGEEVPCPPRWGGYRLVPHSLEFWQGRENRLHDRFLFTRNRTRWDIQRLAP